MDQGTLEGIGTLLAMLAFVAICVWAYSSRNKARFEEAARLPFADDLQDVEQQGQSDTTAASEEVAAQVATNKVGNGI